MCSSFVVERVVVTMWELISDCCGQTDGQIDSLKYMIWEVSIFSCGACLNGPSSKSTTDYHFQQST